jgi:hypothetical protein
LIENGGDVGMNQIVKLFEEDLRKELESLKEYKTMNGYVAVLVDERIQYIENLLKEI